MVDLNGGVLVQLLSVDVFGLVGNPALLVDGAGEVFALLNWKFCIFVSLELASQLDKLEFDVFLLNFFLIDLGGQLFHLFFIGSPK